MCWLLRKHFISRSWTFNFINIHNIYIYVYIYYFIVFSLPISKKGPFYLITYYHVNCLLSMASGWWKSTESDVFCGKRLSGIFSLSLYCSFVMFSQLKTKDLNRKDVACREFDILVSRILLCMTVWDWQNMREACFIFQESNSVDALSDYFLLPAWHMGFSFT